MDTSTIIIGAILLAICILPFVLISRNRKKKERELLNSLSNLANEHHCKISQFEVCGDQMIGIDEDTKSIFFIKQTDKEKVAKYVSLHTVQRCELVKTTANTAGDTIIDRLELKFVPIDSHQPQYIIEFYNSSERFQLSGELQMIEKWFAIILDRIK